MIAWIVRTGDWPYIVAITDSREAAAQILAAVPEQVRVSSNIEVRDDLAWPCFVVEHARGFAFCTLQEAETRVAAAASAGLLDDEDRAVTVYRFASGYQPLRAGRDEMGRLDHVHVGASEAARVASDGLLALWED